MDSLLNVSLLTVRHTGTRFLLQILESAGINGLVGHYGEHRAHKDQDVIISTIRSPWDCYVSWVSRNEFNESFFYAWFEFQQYFEKHDIVIIPIDTPDRGENLQAASNRLNADLKTTWVPVAAAPRKAVNKESIDLTYIYNLPVVKKYYPDGYTATT